MSIDEAIDLLKIERICVRHADVCDRECGKCSLVQDTDKLLEMYDSVCDWLEELKFLKQWKQDIMDSFCKYDVNSFEELVANTRNKTIDDFVKEICKMIVKSENNGNYRFYAVEIKQAIADLAEQLKEGGNIEL